MKKYKNYIIAFVISMGITALGFGLSTIWIPEQDMQTIAEAGMVMIHKNMSLSYNIGVVMLYGGIFGMAISIINALNKRGKNRK